MSGNFRCDACKGMFMSLAPVGHDWLCSGCVSKAAGVGRVLGSESAQNSHKEPSGAPTAPAAEEASEYGWPKKGDIVECVFGYLWVCQVDSAPGVKIECVEIAPAGAVAQWVVEGRGDHDPLRRITSPTAGLRDSAEQAAPDPRAFGRPSDASGVGSSGVGQGEFSDDAIDERWLAFDGTLFAFVRSEVARATNEMLTREQVDQAWDDAGLARTFQHAKFMGCIDATLRGDP